MLEGGKITYKQIILLLFTSRIISWITILPVLQVPPRNQDVWIGCLIAIPLQLLLALPIYLLSKRYENQTFFEYIDSLLGKAGKPIALLYILFFMMGKSR